MDKENTYPLVFVEWLDARGADKAWQYLDDFEPEGLCIIRTVGYLISTNPDNNYLTIAQNMSVEENKEDVQVSGFFYIPKIVVLKKHFIKIDYEIIK